MSIKNTQLYGSMHYCMEIGPMACMEIGPMASSEISSE